MFGFNKGRAGRNVPQEKKVGGGKALREAAAYTQFVLIEPRETALLTLKNRSQIQTLRDR